MVIHDDIQMIRERLEQAETIAVFTHVRPDGDSVGSVLSLGWALMDMGKNVQLIAEDPIPERFHFLFRYTEDGKNPFISAPDHADCYILPDISSIDRAGSFFEKHPEVRPDICIDHHVSNTMYAKLNWIESDSPAACSVLSRFLPLLGIRITPRISSALLCGVLTDTNSFSTSNVTADSLRSAADLVDIGANIFSINMQAYKEHSLDEMNLWRLGMNNIRMEGDMIWSVLTKADRDKIGYTGDDDVGFVSYMGNTKGMNVSVIFIEIDDNETKISWRSRPGYDVSKVAVACGGGGHKAAAGATVYGKIGDIIPAVLEKTRAILASARDQ